MAKQMNPKRHPPPEGASSHEPQTPNKPLIVEAYLFLQVLHGG